MPPTRYQLELVLPDSGAEFSGVLRCEVEVSAPELALHAQELRIDKVEVDGKPAGFELDPTQEELRIHVGGLGRHQLQIAYRGAILDPGLTGLYRSTFPGGSILTTMMYPTGARRVLPCVDQPAAKAVFDVTVDAPAGPLVIFNTPAESIEQVGDRQRVRFAPTPLMSTYLLYLAVGHFAEVTARAGPTELRLALPPGREAAAAFALEHASKALPALNEFYGIPYGLPKLHLVSVPAFWAGAMENWGAVAFRETQLLVDATTSTLGRRLVRETVTHEFAHQWFGNLVTMKWWNDFWLNESFATWMEGTIDTQLYPELAPWSDFQLRFCRWGLEGDAFGITHPIRVAVDKPSELGQIADEVTYGKGATVLRMIAAYVGEERFRAGVSLYLRRHAYGNTVADDLWTALEETAQRPVRRIMTSWIDRPGFPLVSARAADGRLRLSQRRFRYFDGEADEPWPIPLTVRIGKQERAILLDGRETELECPDGATVLLNPGRTGFYRCQYDAALTSRIDAQYAGLTDADRWGLLSDRGALWLQGSASAAELAAELDRASGFPDFLTVEEAFLQLLAMEGIVARQPELRVAFARFFRRGLDSIGLDPAAGEGELVGRLRGRLVFGRVRTDMDFARRLSERLVQFETVSGDLRGPVALAYGMAADARALPALEARMHSAGSEQEAQQLGVALAAVRDPAAVDRVLQQLFQP
ncbi:MAG TPA: M1 family metallopeptidase, partial [Thermoplasmata archaeon]|nr:M1 family metallopeptidase [Thermoplasmata archaeon]